MQCFPRGFIWSREPINPPEGYISGPLDNLYICSDTAVSHASKGRRSVTVLGLCVGIEPQIIDSSGWLLDAMERGAFNEALDLLCGRFVVFVRDQDELRILSDATGMRAVFYRADYEIVASHARLISDATTSDLPFNYGFPGNATPFPEVNLLTPNTLIRIRMPQRFGARLADIRRFWPRQQLPNRTPDEAAAMVLQWTATAIRKVAEKHPVRLALTAGLDSRSMLAVLLYSGVEFETYTYGGQSSDTRVDANVSLDLAGLAGKRHSIIPTRQPNKELKRALARANFARHHLAAIEPLSEWFAERDTIAVTANLLEIGRTFFVHFRKLPPPTTPATMRDLYYRVATAKGKETIAAYGIDCFNSLTEHHFAAFIKATGFNTAREWLDPFDQFYWEHRMSAWHGVSMLERDFYAQAFIPFNARAVFEALLGVEIVDRRSAAAFYRLIELVDPRLLDIPINPKEWPLAA